MIGLLYETGPIQVNQKLRLVSNPNTWANDYSMVFIDQPVGTGFSYVDNGDDDRKKTPDTDEDDDEGDDMRGDDMLNSSDKDSKDGMFWDQELEDELRRDQAGVELIFKKHANQSLEFRIEATQRQQDSELDTMFSKQGYVKNEKGVVADMMVFLEQFYDMYPEQRKADLYIAGQSYAGKFIPSVAKGIMDRNQRVAENKEMVDGFQIPIKGISLGNTMSDPISQIKIHADHAYYMGLVNKQQADLMREHEASAVKEIEAGRFLEATRFRGKVFSVFKRATGNLNTCDIRKGSHPMDWKNATAFLNNHAVKNALNVYGPRTSYLQSQGVSEEEIEAIEAGRARTHFKTDPMVKRAMRGDIMRSVKPLVSELLRSKIKVLAYQGIFDFRDAVAGSTEWIGSLDWSGQEAFRQSDRKVWQVDGYTAGYVNSAPGLTRIAVLGGGHYTPMDQGKNSLVMIQHLIDEKPLEEK
ncbi:hypothetical protein BGZ59_008773 [Podila verticillata]|nr:hypothetical protein BGZ59_008773 [Podila verticillata]